MLLVFVIITLVSSAKSTGIEILFKVISHLYKQEIIMDLE
jgi:hypothetical protein